MKKWIFSSLLLLGLTVFSLYHFAKRHLYIISDHYAKVSYPELLSQAKLLPTFGFLQQKAEILKVSDHYVNELYSTLNHMLSEDEKRCLRPSPDRRGAHITLYGHPRQSVFSRQRYDFNIDGIFKETVVKKFHFFTEYDTWYEVAVKAPELVEVIQIDHPDTLHISIGVSRRIAHTHFCVK